MPALPEVLARIQRGSNSHCSFFFLTQPQWIHFTRKSFIAVLRWIWIFFLKILFLIILQFKSYYERADRCRLFNSRLTHKNIAEISKQYQWFHVPTGFGHLFYREGKARRLQNYCEFMQSNLFVETIVKLCHPESSEEIWSWFWEYEEFENHLRPCYKICKLDHFHFILRNHYKERLGYF